MTQFSIDMDFTGLDIFEYIKKFKTDAILFKVEWLLNQSTGIDEQAFALETISEMIASIGNDFKQERYIDAIAKKHKITKSILSKQIKAIAEEEQEKKKKEIHLQEDGKVVPKGIDLDETIRFGFYELINGVETGYYFAIGTGSTHTKLSNFVVKPLFHIYSRTDNKRMIEINNGFHSKIVEMPSKSMIALEQFKGACYDEGFYLFEGQASHLLKINYKIGDKFPLCYELRTLGWQPEGFWSYANAIYEDKLGVKKFDDFGIAEIEEKKYLSLAVSKIQKEIRMEEDIYKNDRFLWYDEAQIDFKTWADLMQKVYGTNGSMGVAYSVMTAFRDIIFQVTKVPHLYAYGAVQAGKSVFGESVSNLFFKEMPAFNLNQGTDFAFFSRMERFRNCPNALNEFDEHAIKEEWFRAIKSAYDGEGREKGRGGKEGKTRTMEINCTLVIMGQYLSTKDDNSVLSRCIPLAFRESVYSTDQREHFNTLKENEQRGLSGILIELLRHRKKVKKEFPDKFSEVSKRMQERLTEQGKTFKTRILKNICAPLALIDLLKDDLLFPFSYNTFFNYCLDMIIDLSTMISESNSLADFWKAIEFLLDRGEIEEGWNFKVEVQKSITLMGKEDTFDKTFDRPKKVLFVRMNTLHRLYSEMHRRSTGKTATNEQTILLYMKEQPYYIGYKKAHRFASSKEGKETNTSCYVIDYEMLSINLERIPAGEETRIESTLKGMLHKDPVLDESLEKPFMKFSLQCFKQEILDGIPSTKPYWLNCYLYDLSNTIGLVAGASIEVSGMLSDDGKRKTLDIIKFNVLTSGSAEDTPF